MSCRMTKSAITKINVNYNKASHVAITNIKVAKKLEARSKLEETMQEISYRYCHQYYCSICENLQYCNNNAVLFNITFISAII